MRIMGKLITPLGELLILVDGIEVRYNFIRLENNSSIFPNIAGRYKIELEYNSDYSEHQICCIIENIDSRKIDNYAESGERLECQSFYKEDIKLSIGIECDTGYYEIGERIGNYDYDSLYLENGICYHILETTKSHKLVFGIAWINESIEDNDIQTWFAADPTIM